MPTLSIGSISEFACRLCRLVQKMSLKDFSCEVSITVLSITPAIKRYCDGA